MAQDSDTRDLTLSGTVKWFDPVKGFGFIVSDTETSDILLHANVLRNFGQSSVADGANITVVVQKTERGVQATEIVSIDAPVADSIVGLEDIDGLDPLMIADLPFLPARIKWFDKVKGFGFANVFQNSDDIFIHAEVLRRSGLSVLMQGEAIALQIVDGRRGKMAVTVRAWESIK